MSGLPDPGVSGRVASDPRVSFLEERSRIRGSVADLAVKRARVLGILDAREASHLVLRSHAAVSWYLDGARTHVSLAGDPILAVIVSRSGDTVVTNDNELDRLVAEEIPAGFVTAALPWHRPLSDAFPSGALDENDVAPELRRARASLLPGESLRFATLGRECAEVLSTVLPSALPELSEHELAARIAGELALRSIEPLVVLVGGAARSDFRHPLPRVRPLGSRAMVVVCGRRSGLIANLTRWVRFVPATSAERSDEARIREVEATYFSATRAGRSLSDVLADGAAAYAAAGFDAEEWLRHHQGGPAGYNGRDPRAAPTASDLVCEGQAFAWNPTAPGTKTEDTVIVDGGDVRILTVDPAWPSTNFGGLPRPDELSLS